MLFARSVRDRFVVYNDIYNAFVSRFCSADSAMHIIPITDPARASLKNDNCQKKIVRVLSRVYSPQ